MWLTQKKIKTVLIMLTPSNPKLCNDIVRIYPCNVVHMISTDENRLGFGSSHIIEVNMHMIKSNPVKLNDYSNIIREIFIKESNADNFLIATTTETDNLFAYASYIYASQHSINKIRIFNVDSNLNVDLIPIFKVREYSKMELDIARYICQKAEIKSVKSLMEKINIPNKNQAVHNLLDSMQKDMLIILNRSGKETTIKSTELLSSFLSQI